MQPSRTPKLRHHKPSHLGVVTLNGKDTYLGHWPVEARKPPTVVQRAYDALIAGWMANGRQLPVAVRAEPLSVNELIVQFLTRHVHSHYRRPDGTPTTEVEEYRRSLIPVQSLFGHYPAAEFSPLKLKAVREKFLAQDLARSTVSQRTKRVRAMFKWAVSEELVPVHVHDALQTVEGLPAGRGVARESVPVKPVDDSVVAATLPRLSRIVGAMVRLQMRTGMRSGELCLMRTADIDRSCDVWVYIPGHHKTAHRGHRRRVFIGPAGQEVLMPFLRDKAPEAYLFSLRAEREERFAERRAKRKTKVQPSQVCRRKMAPKRLPGERYKPSSYAHRIRKALDAVNRDRTAVGQPSLPHWHPHQIRHAFGTKARKVGGLEGAQAALGHKHAQITEVYAETDQAKAATIAVAIGE